MWVFYIVSFLFFNQSTSSHLWLLILHKVKAVQAAANLPHPRPGLRHPQLSGEKLSPPDSSSAKWFAPEKNLQWFQWLPQPYVWRPDQKKTKKTQ